MNVNDIYTRVGDIVGELTDDETNQSRWLRFINDTRRRIAKRNDWISLRKQYSLKVIVNYSTGTVSCTKGTQTVSGVSTVWTSDMIGRYITLGGSEYYKIIAIGSTIALTIDAPFIGDTITNGNYSIVKIFYRIPGDISKIEGITTYYSPNIIKEMSAKVLNQRNPDYGIVGYSDEYSVAGIYSNEDTYSTGYISGTAGTKIITGSGTAFLDNVVPGDKLVVNGEIYDIESVTSDTTISLFQKIITSPSISSYVITSNPDSLIITLASLTDSDRLLRIDYYQYPFDLLSSTDEDSLTRRYGDLIVDGVIVLEKRYQDDPSWSLDEQKFEKTLAESISPKNSPSSWTASISRYLPWE